MEISMRLNRSPVCICVLNIVDCTLNTGEISSNIFFAYSLINKVIGLGLLLELWMPVSSMPHVGQSRALALKKSQVLD